jgi:hypothetical protein
MIPKTLHYIWLGGAPQPPLVRGCIASWRRFAPGFEVVRWDESNLDMHANAWVEDAMRKKKYSWATDWFRWDILHAHGGIYLDTDMELLQPIDELCEREEEQLFVGIDGYDNLNVAIIGCSKGFHISQRMARLLAAEKEARFYPALLNETLRAMGYRWEDKNAEDEVQRTGDVTIYPKYRFYPKTYGYDLNAELFRPTTLAVHHYTLSWLKGYENNINRVRTYNEYELRSLGG